jgi:hypothetical protein
MTATRRKFLRLLAAGSAATVIAPVAAIAGTRRRTAPKPALTPHPAAPPRVEPTPPVRTAALAEEIKKQKGFVAETLKTVRGYSVTSGIEPAFVFRPMPARRKRARTS